LQQDAAQFGDDRRTAIIQRDAAQAMDESVLISSEPVTVVLSQHGWIRAAKGHEIDAAQLSYKSGDAFLAAACGRSNQSVVFLDSTGRAYTIPAHTLPSARGQGEPLSGRVNPPDGAGFAGLMIGPPEERWLLATDAGFGFLVRLQDVYSRNRSGKSVLRVAKGARVLIPSPAPEDPDGLVAAVSDAGRLLCFALDELPELARGKGNKIFGIPSKKAASGEETLLAIAAVAPGQSLRILSGERHMGLSYKDLGDYRGERGQRGAVLPRGWRRVDGLETVDQ